MCHVYSVYAVVLNKDQNNVAKGDIDRLIMSFAKEILSIYDPIR